MGGEGLPRPGCARPCHPRRAIAWCVGAFVVLGIAYRLMLTILLPVGYDEVFVIAVGLLEMDASPEALWVEVAMEHSSGTAPLWWLTEYLVYRLAGEISLWGLRIAPVLFGIALLPLLYVSARRRFGRRTALWFVALAAGSDALAFGGSRCDFFEPLLLLFLVPLVCRVGGRERGVVRGLLWAGMGLTFFGKALFVIGLSALAEVVILTLVPGGRVKRLGSLAVSSVTAAAPLLLWFGLAQSHYAGRTIEHEATQANDVWSLVASLTLDYQKTKAHVTGTPRDAAQVWLDGRVWPLTALSIGPLLAGLVVFGWHGLAKRGRGWHLRGTGGSGANGRSGATGCSSATGGLSASVVRQRTGRQAARGTRRRSTTAWLRQTVTPPNQCGWPRRRVAMAGLLVWVVAGAGVIISRGTAGARFHLLYLPALWLLAGLALSAIRWNRYVPVVKITALSLTAVALTLGWHHWTDARWSARLALSCGLVMIVTAMAALATAYICRVSASRALASVFIVSAIALASYAGPARWAYSVEFEPMYGTKSLSQLDAYRSGAGPPPSPRRETVYLLLANYFLSPEHLDLQQAERFADLAVRDRPDDATSWFYLGLVYDEQDRPLEQRRQVWQKALQLKPESELIRRRLGAVTSP